MIIIEEFGIVLISTCLFHPHSQLVCGLIVIMELRIVLISDGLFYPIALSLIGCMWPDCYWVIEIGADLSLSILSCCSLIHSK